MPAGFPLRTELDRPVRRVADESNELAHGEVPVHAPLGHMGQVFLYDLERLVVVSTIGVSEEDSKSLGHVRETSEINAQDGFDRLHVMSPYSSRTIGASAMVDLGRGDASNIVGKAPLVEHVLGHLRRKSFVFAKDRQILLRQYGDDHIQVAVFRHRAALGKPAPALDDDVVQLVVVVVSTGEDARVRGDPVMLAVFALHEHAAVLFWLGSHQLATDTARGREGSTTSTDSRSLSILTLEHGTATVNIAGPIPYFLYRSYRNLTSNALGRGKLVRTEKKHHL